MGATILIADDDKAPLGMLKKCFVEAGFTVYTADSCGDAIRLASQHLPDCFLFDYHFSTGTIDSACLFIRRHVQLKNAPIIILSGDMEQAAYCYDACQADVFLDKGGSCYEILAAVKRQLRRIQPKGEVVKWSDLSIDHAAMRVLKNGAPAVSLSQEQFKLFTLLFERNPGFVSEDEISARIFRDLTHANHEAIGSLVYRLRQRLGRRNGRRIKYKKEQGWAYVQPRQRS